LKKMFGAVGALLVGALLIVALSLGGYEMYKFFAPKYRAHYCEPIPNWRIT